MTAPWGTPLETAFGSRPRSATSPWSAVTSNQSYIAAGLRAAAISLALLAVLVFVVLF
jgi:hypothetical protein